MSFFNLWTHFVHFLFLTFTFFYYLITTNVFLNTAAEDATYLEKYGNIALIPYQYLFAGQIAHPIEDRYELKQRFDYHDHFAIHTAGSVLALPISLIAGPALKGLSYLSTKTRSTHHLIAESIHSTHVTPNDPYYESIGIHWGDYSTMETIPSLGHKRRPKDIQHLSYEKEALKDIAAILKEHNIPFWVDCGTCLGAYRYGGVIPWDFDVDVAILSPDFSNVQHALNALDPKKYRVEDWSNRNYPKTYMKIFLREIETYNIDIYNFAINPDDQTIHYILSNKDNMFESENWKIRERRFTVDTPFDVVFPLKLATLDGIEVPVPNQTARYLQLRYGENLEPVKIYNPETNDYEMDLSHPYWQRPFAH